ncbi:recombinase family protein [Halobacillus locisalis]|uniref:Recombinase family protein n=1 Tax=Halobacillus locisalis TaxID=220753 RepID=A0A838CY51_9BACI|nr:recombinase family protein [Halobacillus locisalis]MBA2176861.1 recombinase family protein [Halobacillus locisalis]
MGNTYGYIRVSTKEQNEGRQFHKMTEEIGIEPRRIFIDKLTGSNFERPQYQILRKVIGEGDLIYIDEFTRLGRNYDQVIAEWKYITRELEADIIVLENEELFNSRKFKQMGDQGKLMEDQFLSLLAYVAEQELKKTKKRQKEGIAQARREGKHLGRPAISLDSLSKQQLRVLKEQYPSYQEKQLTAVDFMSKLDLKKNTFYKIIKQYKQEKKGE